MFDLIPHQEIAQDVASTTAIGGAFLWIVRRIRKLHKRVAEIWLFLIGDEAHESLIDRMIKEEYRSRFMLMHAKDGIFECDAEGSCTYVNPTMAKMFDLDAGSMLGKGWLAGIMAEERSTIWDAWSKAVHDQVPYEAVYTLKSGHKVKTLVHICYGAERSRPMCYIGVVCSAACDFNADAGACV